MARRDPAGPLDAAAVLPTVDAVLRQIPWVRHAAFGWRDQGRHLDHLEGSVQDLRRDLAAAAERDADRARQVAVVTVVTLRAAFLGGADDHLDALAGHLQDVPGLIDLEEVGVETRALESPYRGGPVFAQQEGGDATDC